MSMAQHQQLYGLWKKALEARVTMLEAKTKNSSNQNLFVYEKHKAYNITYPVHDRKGSNTR